MPSDDVLAAVTEGSSPIGEAAQVGGAALRPMRSVTFADSFRHAWHGIQATFASQRNLRLQCAIGAIALVLGLLLRLQPLEWAAVVLCAAVVLAAEIANTALEAVVDLASPGYSDLARLAKDAAAGAVLVAAAASVIVGLLVFGPHLLALLRS